MREIFAGYRNLEKHIIWLILADFFFQFVNSTYFILFNFLALDNGYADFEASHFQIGRYIAVALFGVPLGLIIKGRRLRPFMYVGAFLSPISMLTLVWATNHQIEPLIYASMCGMGLAFVLFHIVAVPYIILNAKRSTHSESIAGLFLTWSLSIVIIGILNYFAKTLFPDSITVSNLMVTSSLLGFLAIICLSRIRHTENVSEKVPLLQSGKAYDWGKIAKVLFPTLIIGIGAGFTIPVINLFFKYVHGVEFNQFSLMASCTYLLVVMGVAVIPYIRRRYGYQVAITLLQVCAVIALVMMATTELYLHKAFALEIAVFFYVIRQPFMNVAGPMTSELTMYYVGKRNQEMISALKATIWNTCWLFSLLFFSRMRQMDMSYVMIFLITAGLYIIGVAWYAWLISDFYKRKKAGLIDD